ncbi:hypothetical protein, partial [Klebsiella pneumoniae]|uniref:hypothetical protein n=1 Tax=Klebsiella pneumoniae TaxID=573 RepID=UPI001D0D8E1F
VSGGFSGGFFCVLPVSRQKRPGGLSGGERKGCYGKKLNIRVCFGGGGRTSLKLPFRVAKMFGFKVLVILTFIVFCDKLVPVTEC